MSIITKANTTALVPEDATREILKSVPQQSQVLALATRLANMSAGQRRIPVMSAMPQAYFVEGVPSAAPNNTAGFKKTTKAAWDNVYITAEEIACIVPIPISVLEDAAYDIWAEIRPYIAQAFGIVIDAAILNGTDKPASWADGIVTQAKAAGHEIERGTTGAELYQALLGETGVINMVENTGSLPNAILASTKMRGVIRGAVDTQGQPLFRATGQESQPYVIDGLPVHFDKTKVLTDLAVVGDWSKLVYAIRTDMTYKVLTEAVIQDPTTSAIIYNLAQQDMVALRCYMRIGWALPNPINIAGNGVPFAVLTPVAEEEAGGE